ncbi:hypothetical protein ACLB2K_050242 [Fragaria x ananassa]
MKRTSNNQSQWLVILTATSALLLLALLALTLTHAKYSSSAADYDHRRFANPDQNFIDGDNSYSLELPRLPRFAYLLTGSKGEGPQLKRLLQAAYHPRNHYLLHLDLEASDAERLDLAKYVKSESVMHAFRNAMVVGAADLVTAKGPTVMAATLHAVAILLKRDGDWDWDWFINLSASDYPLMSQERESRSGGEEETRERERRERKREREKYEICVGLIL